jgi:hypothetical protein
LSFYVIGHRVFSPSTFSLSFWKIALTQSPWLRVATEWPSNQCGLGCGRAIEEGDGFAQTGDDALLPDGYEDVKKAGAHGLAGDGSPNPVDEDPALPTRECKREEDFHPLGCTDFDVFSE